MKLQTCKSCKTKYHDKVWIDVCPICRGKDFIRKDYITMRGKDILARLE